MKELTDKEWKEFQKKVIKASVMEKFLGVNMFTTIITIQTKKVIKGID